MCEKLDYIRDKANIKYDLKWAGLNCWFFNCFIFDFFHLCSLHRHGIKLRSNTIPQVFTCNTFNVIKYFINRLLSVAETCAAVFSFSCSLSYKLQLLLFVFFSLNVYSNFNGVYLHFQLSRVKFCGLPFFPGFPTVNYSNEVMSTVPFSSYGTCSYHRVNILGVDFNSLQLLWNRKPRVF